ncbi:hypothetical protein Tco_0116692 [Tanacetum coccineum]
MAGKCCKENGVNILKSIDEGPFQIGIIRDTIAEGTEGAQQLGPERDRVYSDLSPEDKDRYHADIRAINILLQGLPKDIYTLINHYTEVKDIWDNVKMLLEGSELTKEDQESQLYDDFEHFCQNKGETIHDYYFCFAKLINDMRNIKMTMSRIQLNSKFVNNMLPELDRFVTAVGQGNNARGASAAGYGGAQNRVGNANLGQARQIKCYNCNGGQDNVVDEDVDEQPTMFMENLSSTYPGYDKASPSYDSDILFEVHDNDHYQDAVCEHHEVHEMHEDVQPNYVVDSHIEYTSDSNMIPYDQYVKDNAVPVVQSNVSSVPNDAYMMILNDMHKQPSQYAFVTTQNNVVDKSLTAELATYKEQVELYERRAKFELTQKRTKD